MVFLLLFYLILIKDSFEREFLAKRILKILNLPFSRIEPDKIANEITCSGLFTEKRVLLCDNIELYKEKLLSLQNDLILILMAKSKPDFFESVKKEGVTLDLLNEKFWERKSRLQRWVLLFTKDNGKKISDCNYLVKNNDVQENKLILISAGSKRHAIIKLIK